MKRIALALLGPVLVSLGLVNGTDPDPLLLWDPPHPRSISDDAHNEIIQGPRVPAVLGATLPRTTVHRRDKRNVIPPLQKQGKSPYFRSNSMRRTARDRCTLFPIGRFRDVTYQRQVRRE